MLVVGDKKAFLSMYATVSAAGMRAFQLERSDALQGTSSDADAVKAVRNLAGICLCHIAVFMLGDPAQQLPAGC